MAATIQLGTRIDSDVHQRLKLLCVIEGRQMSGVVRDLVEGWVQEREADPDTRRKLEQLMARQQAIEESKSL